MKKLFKVCCLCSISYAFSDTMNVSACNDSVVNLSDKIGPRQLHDIFGNVSILMFAVIPLMIILMTMYTLFYRPPESHPLKYHILILQLAPTGTVSLFITVQFLLYIQF